MAGSYAAWYLPFSGYTIQSGDRLHWRQYQDSAKGGIGISFTQGGSTNWTAHDTDGDTINSDPTELSWHQRTVDLSSYAGKTINHFYIVADAGTPVGNWVIPYGDISIVHSDGTVTTIYDRATSESFSYFTGGGETSPEAWVEHAATAHTPLYPEATTTYFLADQIHSTRMTLAYGGWPMTEDTYYPFGVEPTPSASPDQYKFSGKERDAESGLDYFGARYYGSTMGRFMSPDPAGLVFASLANPQSLNLYSYAQNNPLIYTDPTGLDCAYLNDAGTGIETGGVDQNGTSRECGQTGGYWVSGTLTNAQIDANAGTVQLTGTNDGTDVTHASYQDTSVYVDSWLNTPLNQAGHITIGLAGQQQVGQNPRSDADFLSNILLYGFKFNVVPGAIQPEATSKGTPSQLRSFALIQVTGMQAQMIQNSINQSTAAPPNYSLNPALGLDCATWAQQVLHDAGIQTGPMQPYPNDLMKQLNNQFTVLPGHQ